MQSYHLTQWVLFFFIYSFIGWGWECCFVSVRKRRWVNRGFMYGPMLPIYGFGALAVLISTIRVRDSIPLIFLFGMVGATLLEYVTGAVMERLFNVKYWDYSNQKFNLNGYICLTSSLGWGLFSVLLVKFVHVPIEGAVLKIPTIIAEGIAFVLTVAAAVDVTQSFNDAMDLKRILAQLEESKKQIRKIQEKLKVASEEFVEDYRQRAGEFVEDYRRRVEEHVEDYRGRAEEMAEDYKKLAEAAGVDVITGTAFFTDPNHIMVANQDGMTEELEGDNFYINTGARPFIPPIKGIHESNHVYISETLMEEERLPKNLVIIGGGYIGVEFASYYSNFGSQVTVIQNGKDFIPREDQEVAQAVLDLLKKKGVRIMESTEVESVRDG